MVNIDDVTPRQKNSIESSVRNKNEVEFWKDYDTYGFLYIMRKYFGWSKKNRLKSRIKFMLFKMKATTYSN